MKGQEETIAFSLSQWETAMVVLGLTAGLADEVDAGLVALRHFRLSSEEDRERMRDLRNRIEAIGAEVWD